MDKFQKYYLSLLLVVVCTNLSSAAYLTFDFDQVELLQTIQKLKNECGSEVIQTECSRDLHVEGASISISEKSKNITATEIEKCVKIHDFPPLLLFHTMGSAVVQNKNAISLK